METVTKILITVGTVVLLALLMTFPLMWLWNWLMPDLFNVAEIGFWQALGLNFLASILFKKNNSTSSD